MATVSSHVLDAIRGCPAVGVHVDCVRLSDNGNRDPVFSTQTDSEGRIAVPVEVQADDNGQYELEFHTQGYFDADASVPQSRQIMRAVVIRITMHDPEARYHIPVIVSPHSYSVWWSA